MNNFLSLADAGPGGAQALVDLARSLEREPRPDVLAGKVLGLLFLNPSLRTLASFQAGMARLGELIRRYGSDGFARGIGELNDYAERLAGEALAHAHPSALANIVSALRERAFSDDASPPTLVIISNRLYAVREADEIVVGADGDQEHDQDLVLDRLYRWCSGKYLPGHHTRQADDTGRGHCIDDRHHTGANTVLANIGDGLAPAPSEHQALFDHATLLPGRLGQAVQRDGDAAHGIAQQHA